MNILVFINIGEASITEEMIANKLTKIVLFQGGTLNKSLDNKDVWILKTKISDEFRKYYTQNFWKHIGDNVCKLFDIPVYVSIYANNLSVYPKFCERRNSVQVSKVKEILFDFSGDDISTNSIFW